MAHAFGVLAYYIGRFFNLAVFRHVIWEKTRKNRENRETELKIFLTFFS